MTHIYHISPQNERLFPDFLNDMIVKKWKKKGCFSMNSVSLFQKNAYNYTDTHIVEMQKFYSIKKRNNDSVIYYHLMRDANLLAQYDCKIFCKHSLHASLVI